MAGMYPVNKTLSVFGKEMDWPGLADGKFSNGSFEDPLVPPSCIPAETLNLILDNLGELVAGLGETPDNTNPGQVAAAVKGALASLKNAVQADLALKAPLASPVFTGTPKVPGKTSAAGNDGTLAATEAQVYLKADKASPAFTGTPTAPTAAASANTTQIATTAFVKAALTALVNSSPAALDTLQELAAALGNDPNFATTVTNALAEKAPLASPVFTGTPKVPSKTAAAANTGTLIATEAQVYLKADKASPALTGTPTAPTAAVSVNSTQIATTAFTHAVAKNDAWPVGSFYTQYPLTGQSTIAAMFPSSGSPATLFGGTWTEMYAGEKVFFMGGLSSVESNRSAGIQEDAIRNITGSASGINAVSDASYSGAFYVVQASGNRATGVNNNISLLFDASRTVPTDTTNHPKNRPIKVWRRTA